MLTLRRLTGAQGALVVVHVAALGAWWLKSSWPGDLAGPVATGATTWVAAALALLGIGALLAYMTLPEPTDDRARDAHVRWSVSLHLTYTWAMATCLALWAFRDYAQAAHDTPHEEALKVWFLALGFFGGFLNLTRSTGTRSQTSTIHATTMRMVRQLDRLQRGQETNALLFTWAVNAQLAETREELGQALTEMVDAARSHPWLPAEKLAVSLWVRGLDQWRILASAGISEGSQEAFTQPVVDQETPGAGVVANLAATGRRMLIEASIDANPWYKSDPRAPQGHSGMAVVTVENAQGESVAALCLTARPGTLLPSSRDDSDAHRALVRRLIAWKIAFTLPVVKLLEL
ncbi:MAG: hypothetical protein KTR31_40480 [Myxococcales bacterium]|nr:hypothetical protein [Myxococcales bacterium]